MNKINISFMTEDAVENLTKKDKKFFENMK